MRRTVGTGPKFSLGDDELPPAAVTPAPRASAIAVRFLLRILPRALLLLTVILLVVALIPGGWRVALCSVGLLPGAGSKSDVKLYGHRGGEFPYPENTLDALKEGAALLGSVELDLALTSDGEVVVMHDEELNRTTDGTGITCTRPLSYVQKLVVKMPERDPRGKLAQGKMCEARESANGPMVSCKYRVPTFEQVLDALPRNTSYMLDIKECATPDAPVIIPQCSNCSRLLNRTKDLLKRYFISPQQVVVTSTLPGSLRVFSKGMLSRTSFALSINQGYSHYTRSRFLSLFDEDDWDGAAMYKGLVALRPDLVKALTTSVSKRSGLRRRAYAWTVRSDIDLRACLCAGVDSLIVGDPRRARKAMRAL